MRTWYAHSLEGRSKAEWEPLKEHLDAVSSLCRIFTRRFGIEEMGEASGFLHDFGKLDPEFQDKLDGVPKKVDHASPGAAAVLNCYGPLGPLLASVIAGHHTGLADGTQLGDGEGSLTPLDRRVESATQRLEALRTLARSAGIDIPGTVAPPVHFRPRESTDDARAFSLAFLTRMLFSALVDADFLATEAFYASAEMRSVDRGDDTSLERLRDALTGFLAAKQNEAARQHPGIVNDTRGKILRHVREGASLAPGAFTLTVPTGGGKTLASLAFALDHAIVHGLERVIVVIPFVSVVEQTAKVYRDALGEFADSVVEHHAALDEEKVRGREGRDKLALATENWDARIVVTTAVQFFESLYANRPSRCRKLHRLARAAIILDEAQTLPLPLLQPAVLALGELATNYGSSVVLSTATQPAIVTRGCSDDLPFALRGARELAPEPPKLFGLLKRVTIEQAGPLDDGALADCVAGEEQALVIVNTRRHARELYRSIADMPGAWHLSTFMCAAHRADTLALIRRDLARGKPCRVIATSLIEAGVDIDFPKVFRAAAGLEQVAQAAGRCNREGSRAVDSSRVVVFEPGPENDLPALALQAAAARTIMRWAEREGRDLLDPETIEAYFREVYFMRRPAPGAGSPFDEKRIVELLATGARSRLFPFETVAARFRLIDNVMVPILIPFDDAVRERLRALHHVDEVGGLARRLQRYLVNVPRSLRAELVKRGAARPIQPEKFECQFVELVDRTLYRDDVGLDGLDPAFMEVASLVV